MLLPPRKQEADHQQRGASRARQNTALVGQAGTTKTEGVTSIRRVSDILGEIRPASSEQSQGVAQIGEAVQQMEHVTQQNAALAATPTLLPQ